jgi:thymidine kinase
VGTASRTRNREPTTHGQTLLLLLHDERRQVDVAAPGGVQLRRARHVDATVHGGRIASRIGIGIDAEHFEPDTDFWETLKDTTVHCVLIDEAQFLTKTQVRQLARVVDEVNVPVMCYGLRTDFMGELFPGSAALLAWSDTLTELKTICYCGRKATMVVRVSPTGAVERAGQQVEVGGNDRYVSLCRKHFSEALQTGICPGWKSA